MSIIVIQCLTLESLTAIGNSTIRGVIARCHFESDFKRKFGEWREDGIKEGFFAATLTEDLAEVV
jgi:hypothetical protein